MSYSNVNDFIVIADDNRDPYVSWRNHRNRGSAGGVDCVAPIGTPVYAPDDCVTQNIPDNGTGGNTVTMRFPDGFRDQFMHLSKLVPEGPKQKGDLVGYSGDSASPGQPHVHWHRIDTLGRRRNPWDFFETTTVAGVTDVSPVETISGVLEDTIMLILIATTDDPKGVFKKGSTFANDLTGPLTLLSGAEMQGLEYWAKKGLPYRRAEWTGKQIRDLITVRGMRPYAKTNGRSDYSKVSY